MERTFSLDKIEETVLEMNPEMEGFSKEGFLTDDIALTDGESYALFEKDSDGLYTGHYLFKKRGKEAHDLAVTFLRELFSVAKAVKGIVDKENRRVSLFTRRLGFKKYTEIPIKDKIGELFIMTKSEFIAKHGEV